MDLSRIPLFEMMARRMGWLNQRQEVLSQNIANADTPNYVPSDLEPMDFRAAMRTALPVMPVATDPAHLAGGPGIDRPERSEKQRKRYETAPSGNAVVLEEQLIKMAETQSDYQMVTNLYRKHVDMIKLALGGGT